MNTQQSLAFAIIGLTMVMFAWGRVRYDLVALLALLASVAVGIVPADRAFSGFADDVLVIVASALVVSAAVARSGVVEVLFRGVLPFLTTINRQVVVLVSSVTLVSALVKNIGALATFMPVAFQLERRTGTPVSKLLMPMSFGSLLGGLMTLIGTSPNIIVSKIREQLTGQPFAMFDFFPVGACIAAGGVLLLAFAHRLLQPRQSGMGLIESALKIRYTTETQFRPDSPFIGRTVEELEGASEGEVVVSTIIRERFRRYTPSRDWTLLEGDILLLQGEAAALDQLVKRAGLALAVGHDRSGDHHEDGFVEAVVTAASALIDRSAAHAGLGRLGVELVAFSRSGQQITRRLETIRFRAGDLVVLRGPVALLPEALVELGLLPLGRAGFPARPDQTAALAGVAAADRARPHRVSPGSCRGRVLRCRRPHDPHRLAHLEAGLRGHRRAHSGAARCADSGQRRHPHDRRHRAYCRLAVAHGAEPATIRFVADGDGSGHGGHALSQQCGDRADDGAGGGRICN
jgi:di/tricarboxylate transporter